MAAVNLVAPNLAAQGLDPAIQARAPVLNNPPTAQDVALAYNWIKAVKAWTKGRYPGHGGAKGHILVALRDWESNFCFAFNQHVAPPWAVVLLNNMQAVLNDMQAVQAQLANLQAAVPLLCKRDGQVTRNCGRQALGQTSVEVVCNRAGEALPAGHAGISDTNDFPALPLASQHIWQQYYGVATTAAVQGAQYLY